MPIYLVKHTRPVRLTETYVIEAANEAEAENLMLESTYPEYLIDSSITDVIDELDGSLEIIEQKAGVVKRLVS
jgi:hypothetical protein